MGNGNGQDLVTTIGALAQSVPLAPGGASPIIGQAIATDYGWNILVRIFSAHPPVSNGIIVRLSGVMQQASGDLIPYQFDYQVPGPGGASGNGYYYTVPLTKGYLISCYAQLSPASELPATNRVYVDARIVRGDQNNFSVLIPLFADYINPPFITPLGYPYNTKFSSYELRVPVINATVTPAAGQEFVFNPPANPPYQGKFLAHVHLWLITSAVAANRFVAIKIVLNNNTQEVSRYITNNAIVASSRMDFDIGPGYATSQIMQTATIGMYTINCPLDTFMIDSIGSDTLQTVTTGMDGGDQWNGILIFRDNLAPNF